MITTLLFTFLLLYFLYKSRPAFRTPLQLPAQQPIMGNSNPHNAAAQAAVEEEHLREQARGQAEDLNRQRDALEQQRLDGIRRREEEKKRADELEKQTEKKIEDALKQDQERKRAERDREDLQSRTQDSQLRQTIEEGNKVLDNQRGANARETEKLADRHKDSMTNVSKQHEKVEEKTAKRVLDLADERKQAQDKLHLEKAAYADKKLSEKKEHHAKVERLELKKTEILVEREKNAVQHQERLSIMHEAFAVQTHQVVVARSLERVEINFADAVNNIRGSDDGLRKAVGIFSRFSMALSSGLPMERVINQAKDAQSRAVASLVVLHDNAAAILNQRENNNGDAVKCHASARAIQRLIGDITPELGTILMLFRENLTPQQQTSAIATIEKIRNLSRELAEVIIDMPVVYRQDHVRRQIMQNVEAIANMSISGRVAAPAIQENRNGGTSGGVVEEVGDEGQN